MDVYFKEGHMTKRLKKMLIVWGIAIIIGVTFFALIFFITGASEGYSLRLASDATFIPGLVMLLFVALTAITQYGTFDLMQYGMLKFWHYVRPNRNKNEELDAKKGTFETPHDYIEYKKERRKKAPPHYLPFVVVGGVLTVLGIIFALV